MVDELIKPNYTSLRRPIRNQVAFDFLGSPTTVIPAKAGIYKSLKILDFVIPENSVGTGKSRNDKQLKSTFYEVVKK